MERSLVLDALQEVLPVPHNIRSVILPALVLSVFSFLNFRVPSIIASTLLLERADLFSKEPGIITASNQARMLFSLHVPNLEQLRSFYECIISAHREGHSSFLFPLEQVGDEGVVTTTVFHLPLWVFTYWVEVRLVLGAKAKWRKVVEWLESHPKYLNATEGLALLRTLTWGHTLPIDMGSGGSPLSLTRFALNSWLSEDNMDQIAVVLDTDLKADRKADTTIFPYSALHKLISIHRTATDRDAYSTLRKIPHVTAPGKSIAAGSLKMLCISVAICLGGQGTLALPSDNRQANHWVSLVIQTEPPSLYFADPMGHTAPQELIDVFVWWLGHYHSGTFIVHSMMCASQARDDGDSCGLLSANALRHFCYPDTPLMDPKKPNEARIDAFVSVVRLIQENVCLLFS